MEMSLRTAFLYYNTLRYLKPCQIYGRVTHTVRMQAHRWLSPVLQWGYSREAARRPAVLQPRLDPWLQYIHCWGEEDHSQRFDPESILGHRFCFLNQEVTFDGPVDWRASAMPKLWRYNLHYFDYLPDLARAYRRLRPPHYLEKIRSLVDDWIAANPLGMGDGWEPYPLSLRIIQWIKTYVLLASAGPEALAGDPVFHHRFLKSLYTQAAFLERNLEHHLLGNHLVKNARALLYAGLFFDGADAVRWRSRGRTLLDEQLDEQVLPDGGHFERSPMYHTLVLEDFAESLALMKACDFAPNRFTHWRARVIDMARFLDRILHPDQQIPLFNDSAFGVAPAPVDLIDRVHRVFGRVLHLGETSMRFTELAQTGYFVIQDRSGRNKMILDCGQLGPDYLPGHAHSDTLSYELSYEGERIIVDTGVYEYRAGALRDYCRRTAAHNTVKVDGLEQSEVWGSFRVAHRALPAGAAVRDAGEYVAFEGAHTGYLARRGVSHTRRVLFIEPALWLVVDRLDGQGTHLLEGFIHLHPDVSASLRPADDEVTRVQCAGRSGHPFVIQVLPPSRIDIKSAPYFPEFGKRTEAKVVRYWLHDTLPASLVYLIAPAERCDLQLQWLDNNLLSLVVNGERRLIPC